MCVCVCVCVSMCFSAAGAAGGGRGGGVGGGGVVVVFVMQGTLSEGCWLLGVVGASLARRCSPRARISLHPAASRHWQRLAPDHNPHNQPTQIHTHTLCTHEYAHIEKQL